jgi:glycogenin glucosyltransferase
MNRLKNQYKMLTFVTLVTSDAYLPGALTLAHSIRRSGSTIPIAVMVTPISLSQNTLSDLYRAFDRVIHVTPLRSSRSRDRDNLELLGRPELDVTLTKLHVWNPEVIGEHIQMVAFLDADAFVIAPPQPPPATLSSDPSVVETLPPRVDAMFEILGNNDFAAAPDVGWP